jgi:alkylated DNA nucleotide flippase Atl1
MVARAAATYAGFPNAHRVLGHDGTIVRGPNGDGDERRARRRLVSERVTFDRRGRADGSLRVHWDELQRRSGGSARTLSVDR